MRKRRRLLLSLHWIRQFGSEEAFGAGIPPFLLGGCHFQEIEVGAEAGWVAHHFPEGVVADGNEGIEELVAESRPVLFIDSFFVKCANSDFANPIRWGSWLTDSHDSHW
jgi:hypothetical protein